MTISFFSLLKQQSLRKEPKQKNLTNKGKVLVYLYYVKVCEVQELMQERDWVLGTTPNFPPITLFHSTDQKTVETKTLGLFSKNDTLSLIKKKKWRYPL